MLVQHYPNSDCTIEVTGPNHTPRKPEMLIQGRGIGCDHPVARGGYYMEGSPTAEVEYVADRVDYFRDTHELTEIALHDEIHDVAPALGSLVAAQLTIDQEAAALRNQEALRELQGDSPFFIPREV